MKKLKNDIKSEYYDYIEHNVKYINKTPVKRGDINKLVKQKEKISIYKKIVNILKLLLKKIQFRKYRNRNTKLINHNKGIYKTKLINY